MDRRTVFNGRLLPVALLLPQLLLTLFFFYWPAGEAVWSSLTTQDPFGQGFVYVGLDNFRDLFSDPLYPRLNPAHGILLRRGQPPVDHHRPDPRGPRQSANHGAGAV